MIKKILEKIKELASFEVIFICIVLIVFIFGFVKNIPDIHENITDMISRSLQWMR